MHTGHVFHVDVDELEFRGMGVSLCNSRRLAVAGVWDGVRDCETGGADREGS